MRDHCWLYFKTTNYVICRDLTETGNDMLQQEMRNFLNDLYPGANEVPTELVGLMTSPDLDKAIVTSAVINPEDSRTCVEAQTISNNNFNGGCPPGWLNGSSYPCLYFSVSANEL